MKVIKRKDFTNGSVFALELSDGRMIEVTDTFLPYATKNCINGTNVAKDGNIGSRADRWMIGVSTMSGCPVGCKFCATGQMKGWRNLTKKEITDQILFVLEQNAWKEGGPFASGEFRINYTRMGEPFLNLDNVREAIDFMDNAYKAIRPEDEISRIHHYVSTVGIQGSDFSWIKDNITLQISLHSLDEARRRELIPINNLMPIEELGQIRTKSNLKTTINLTLTDPRDFDIKELKKYFDPAHFFIKISPLNDNVVSESNGLKGIIIGENEI